MEEFKRDLAIGYIHKWLSPTEKQEVFKLILTDVEFIKILKEEQEISKMMKCEKCSLEPNQQEELLARTLATINDKEGNNNNDPVTNLVVDMIISATIPAIAAQFMKIKR